MMSIVTSSADPGMLFVSQFAAVSQLLSPPPPVQITTESRVLDSIHSIRGRLDIDRTRLPVRSRAKWGAQLEHGDCLRSGGEYPEIGFIRVPRADNGKSRKADQRVG